MAAFKPLPGAGWEPSPSARWVCMHLNSASVPSHLHLEMTHCPATGPAPASSHLCPAFLPQPGAGFHHGSLPGEPFLPSFQVQLHRKGSKLTGPSTSSPVHTAASWSLCLYRLTAAPWTLGTAGKSFICEWPESPAVTSFPSKTVLNEYKVN